MSVAVEGKSERPTACRMLRGRTRQKTVRANGVGIDVVRVLFGDQYKLAVRSETHLRGLRPGGAQRSNGIRQRGQRSISLNGETGNVRSRAFGVEDVEEISQDGNAIR